MISNMRLGVKLVALLATIGASGLTSSIAVAQDATTDNGWFNGASAPADGGQAPPANAAPSTPAPGPDETDPRALTEFHSQLEPYGTWVDDPKYGTVWVPNREQVGNDFAPYVSSGHWALDEGGDWVWVSDYPFGNVVFHYGRWVWIPESGWAWVPGYRYANAWVVWRVPTDDYAYVGWAPMPPTWGWYGGFAVGWGWYAPVPYVFCPSAYVFSYRVNTYIVHDRYRINEIAGHTTRYGGYGGAYGGRYGTAYGAHTPASPHAMPANAAIGRGPSLQAAHVPSSAAPTSRVPYARPFTSAEQRSGSVGVGYRTYSSGARPSYSSAPASTGGRYYSSPGANYAPSARAPSAARSGPYYGTPYRSAGPAGTPRYAPTQQYSAPSAPRYAAPSQRYSAPVQRYSPPAQHYSAPAQHYSAPAPRYSAPATHYSAPSRGGGSFRGGGGFRGGGRR